MTAGQPPRGNPNDPSSDPFRRAGRSRRLDLESDPAASLITIYTPESALRDPRGLLAGICLDIWTGRELAWRMFVRNLRGMYRQTLLGLFWAFLPPLANTMIWVFLAAQNVVAFAQKIPNYAAYVFAGMVIWQSFIEALQAPLNAVQANRNMLSKLRFPRESILLVGLLEVLFNLLIRSLLLLLVLLWFGADWSSLTWLAPAAALGVVLLGIGLGCFLMPFGVLYHDIGRLLLVVIPVWMIVTQIVYPAPAGWASSPLNWANPASPLLLLCRDLLVLGQSEYWVSAGCYALAVIPLCILGLIFYRVSLPVLVERMAT